MSALSTLRPGTAAANNCVGRTGEYIIFKRGGRGFALVDYDANEVSERLEKAGGFWPALTSVLPPAREAHWLTVYLHDLTTLLNSKYDDQVDSTSQVLAWAKQGPSAEDWVEYIRQQVEAPFAGANRLNGFWATGGGE